MVHKTSGQFVQIADVVLTQRDSYSGNLKWGPGVITFSKHPGDSDADFEGGKVPGFEKPRSIGSKTFYKVSQRAPLAPKCLYVSYLQQYVIALVTLKISVSVRLFHLVRNEKAPALELEGLGMTSCSI